MLKSTIVNFNYYIDLFKLDTDDNALSLFYVFDNNFWPGAGADYFFPEVGAD